MRRVAAGGIAVSLLVVAAAVQLTLLPRLGLPVATPELVLVVVAAIGSSRGMSVGAVSGFGAGLLLDLAPPADHPVGQWALVLTLVGFAAGRFNSDQSGAAPVRCTVIAGLSALATAGYLAVSAVLGLGWPGTAHVGLIALASGAYAGAAATVVLPVTGWLLGSVGRTAPRW